MPEERSQYSLIHEYLHRDLRWPNVQAVEVRRAEASPDGSLMRLWLGAAMVGHVPKWQPAANDRVNLLSV